MRITSRGELVGGDHVAGGVSTVMNSGGEDPATAMDPWQNPEQRRRDRHQGLGASGEEIDAKMLAQVAQLKRGQREREE